jgi:hypothetical protein
MSTAEEYRAQADRCDRLVAAAAPGHRLCYATLSAQWRQMADQIAWIEAQPVRFSRWDRGRAWLVDQPDTAQPSGGS